VFIRNASIRVNMNRAWRSIHRILFEEEILPIEMGDWKNVHVSDRHE
jgi:hypothetical protein